MFLNKIVHPNAARPERNNCREKQMQAATGGNYSCIVKSSLLTKTSFSSMMFKTYEQSGDFLCLQLRLTPATIREGVPAGSVPCLNIPMLWDLLNAEHLSFQWKIAVNKLKENEERNGKKR